MTYEEKTFTNLTNIRDGDFPQFSIMTIMMINDYAELLMMMMKMIMMVMMMLTFQDLRSEAKSEASRKAAEIANKETRKKVSGHKSPLENK